MVHDDMFVRAGPWSPTDLMSVADTKHSALPVQADTCSMIIIKALLQSKLLAVHATSINDGTLMEG
jgi:hypothetical protein